MKKYLLGIFAIAMALGFSAFNTVNVKATKSVKILDQFNYWYEAQTDGTVGPIFYTGAEGPRSKDELAGVPCPDAGGPACLVGSNVHLTASNPIPAQSGDNYILKN